MDNVFGVDFLEVYIYIRRIFLKKISESEEEIVIWLIDVF